MHFIIIKITKYNLFYKHIQLQKYNLFYKYIQLQNTGYFTNIYNFLYFRT